MAPILSSLLKIQEYGNIQILHSDGRCECLCTGGLLVSTSHWFILNIEQGLASVCHATNRRAAP